MKGRYVIHTGARDIVCPSCGAKPGDQCRSAVGGATRSHQQRINAAMTATRDGNREARSS